MPEQYRPFAIVWQYAGGGSLLAESFGLSGETGAVPFFVDTRPLTAENEAVRAKLDNLGLLKGLLYAWDKECGNPAAVDKKTRRRLLDELIFVFKRPSLETAIVEVAGAIRKNNGLEAGCAVLRNGMEIKPESSVIRSEFILTASFLLLKTGPERQTGLLNGILEAYSGIDPEKLIPGARESLPLLKLAAHNALGETEKMREYYRAALLGKTPRNQDAADQAERLILAPNLTIAEAFEPVLSLISLGE